MKKAEFNRQIKRAWILLHQRLTIAKYVGVITSLDVDEDFRRTALSEKSSYVDIYRTGLSRSHYNILFFDYSYLQFSWTNESEWRLAFLPNPWVCGVESAQQRLEDLERRQEETDVSYEDISDELAAGSIEMAVPPIRFEYSASQYREIAHPTAHFHIGRHTGNRWASSVQLGPFSFSMLVAKAYYPQAWRTCSAFHQEGAANCLDSVLISHLGSEGKSVPFSRRESSSFHFSGG